MPRNAFLLLMALAISFSAASADWPTDINTAVPICTEFSGQSYSSMIEDGFGNYLVTWTDYRDGDGTVDIYMQRFGADGTAHWDIDGELVVTPTTSIYDPPILVPDGQGGAYVVFTDSPSGVYVEILVQRVDATGTTMWNNPINIVPSEEEISSRVDPAAVADGLGNVVIVFQDYRSGVSDIWSQRILANGDVSWTDYGTPVCQATGIQADPAAVSDGEGGGIFAWEDERNEASQGTNLYMQHVIQSGATIWMADGAALATYSGDQRNPVGAPDGSGGALFAWEDERGGDWDVYLSRVEPDYGSVWWAISGVPACVDVDDQLKPQIIGDGHGGAFLAWTDYRSDGLDGADIYAQHVANSGALLWTTSAILAGGNDSGQGYYGIDLALDGQDGVFVVWSGGLGAGAYQTDLIGQRLSAAGSKYWGYYGRPIATQSGNQTYPSIANHPDGGVVMTFETWDNIDDLNIYASYIDEHGYPGDVAPAISNVLDFPADQGGVVILNWWPSYRDNPAQGIEDYTIWKRLHLIGAGVPDPAELRHALTSGLPEWKVAELLRVGWTYVDALDAAFQDEYGYDAPTYGDTTDEVTILSDYKVIARESETVFWESEIGTGSSVDNLAPGAPLNLAALVDLDNVDLSWSPSGYHDEDLAIYNLYRSDTAGFTPDPGNFLAASADTTFLDVDPGAGLWFYLVTAQDLHGNEGLYSNEAMAELITAVNEGGTPEAFAIRGNWPNPFNPLTKIGFDLPSEGRVRLELFDSAGRRVATLLDEHLAAGSYHELWRGLDEAGRPVASGLYLTKLSFGGKTATHRMLLLK